LLLAMALAAPEMSPVRTHEPPVIDGRLDDRAWALAPATRAFTQKFPLEGAPPTEETTLRVLYDDEALYVAFDSVQTLVPVVARMARRDREVEADNVSISIDSRALGKNAFEFVVNAAGVLRDGIRANDVVDEDDSRFSDKWDENWSAATRVHERGWSAELRIPLRILRFSPAPVQSWGFQARRYVSLRQEIDEWTPLPRAVKSEVPAYGRLVGMRLRPRSELELRPFVLGRVLRRDVAPERLAHGVDVEPSAGLDLRWHVTPDLTLDGTFNPDFTQVEGDELFLNLSNFEAFFPEKRPFFVEGAEVFESPTPIYFARPFQLLYTRRIGRIGPAPPVGPGERVVDTPRPAPILGATKLVGRLSNGWSVGAMSALTAESLVHVQDAGGARSARVSDPMSAYHTVRVKHDFGAGNAHVGFLGTAVQRAETTAHPRSVCPDGAPLPPGGRCAHDAYVAGLDGLWRSKDGEVFASAQAIASVLQNGAPRKLRDATVLSSGDAGWGVQANVARDGGAGLAYNFQYQAASRKLDFNDVGYMQRQNQHYYYANVEYRTFEPLWKTIETRSWLECAGRATLDGVTLQRRWLLDTLVRYENFWTTYTEINFDEKRFDDREIGDGVPFERGPRPGGVIEVSSDRRRSVFVRAMLFAQRPADGVNGEARIRTFVRAHPQLDLEAIFTGTHTDGEPRFAGRDEPGGQARFGKLRASSFASTLRASFSFTPRLALSSFAQLYLAAGHYYDFRAWAPGPGTVDAVHLADLTPVAAPSTSPDFVDASLNVNAVMRWEYTTGSILYLVYTRAQLALAAQAPGDAVLALAPLGRAPAADTWLLKWQVFATL